MMPDIHKRSDVVVIGGGIFGCAISYYYTKNNPGKKIIVLERNEICNSATSRAAALMTIVRSKKSYIPLSLETYRAVADMEKQLGESLGMKMTGMMHVAASEKSVIDLEDIMAVADQYKQEAFYISNDEAAKKSPWLNTEEAIKIGFIPNEAYCDPYLLGTFFMRCAKMQGAEILQGIEVTGLIKEGNAITGVETSNGRIHADTVIDAAGAWAPIWAMEAGAGLPMSPVRSQYWITEKSSIFPVNSPMVLLPDAQAYARPEGGALLFGIREKKSMSVSPKDIPAEITDFIFSDDNGMNDLQEVIDKLARFFPALYDIGIKNYIAGFSGYTPDTQLVLGEVSGT
ncbi:MAG: FAD-binding oxidoreductase, partial [Bacteroidota bacterium]|nr:FAD-binding oxidoreductase [Bacteroidota bacterium]